MPVAGMNVREGPRNAMERKAALERVVLVDIRVVIVINKIVLERLAENRPRDNREGEADAENCPPGRACYRSRKILGHRTRLLKKD